MKVCAALSIVLYVLGGEQCTDLRGLITIALASLVPANGRAGLKFQVSADIARCQMWRR